MVHFQVQNKVAKLCDFGSSRIESFISGSADGIVTHASPELLERKRYSYSHDIYSLAILLWEFWYGRDAFSDKEYEAIPTHTLQNAIITGERPKFKEQTAPVKDLKALIQECWEESPEKRPSAHQVKDKLQNIFKSLYDCDVSEENRKHYPKVQVVYRQK